MLQDLSPESPERDTGSVDICFSRPLQQRSARAPLQCLVRQQCGLRPRRGFSCCPAVPRGAMPPPASPPLLSCPCLVDLSLLVPHLLHLSVCFSLCVCASLSLFLRPSPPLSNCARLVDRARVGDTSRASMVGAAAFLSRASSPPGFPCRRRCGSSTLT